MIIGQGGDLPAIAVPIDANDRDELSSEIEAAILAMEATDGKPLRVFDYALTVVAAGGLGIAWKRFANAGRVNLNKLGDDDMRQVEDGLNGAEWVMSFPEHIQADPMDALHMEGMPNLERIPSFSGGSLWLNDSPKLKEIGAIRLGRDLHLDNCVSMVSLPGDMRIKRHLHMKGCSSWDGILPDSAVVGGKVFTDRYPKGAPADLFRAAGANVTDIVRGARSPEGGFRALMAAGAPFGHAIDALADRFGQEAVMEAFGSMDGIVIPGDVNLQTREWVDRLPNNCTVKGDLKISWKRMAYAYAARVRELPDGLTVEGDLTAEPGHVHPRTTCVFGQADGLGPDGRHRLDRIGKGVTIFGAALLNGSDILEVPDGTTFGGSVAFNNCRSLTRVGKGVTFGGTASFYSCADLTELPIGLSVNGILDLRSCDALKALPNGISVTSELRCPKGIRTLSEGMRIGGDLNLVQCVDLRSWPKEAAVKGRIIMCDDFMPVGYVRISTFGPPNEPDPPKRFGHKSVVRDYNRWSR